MAHPLILRKRLLLLAREDLLRAHNVERQRVAENAAQHGVAVEEARGPEGGALQYELGVGRIVELGQRVALELQHAVVPLEPEVRGDDEDENAPGEPGHGGAVKHGLVPLILDKHGGDRPRWGDDEAEQEGDDRLGRADAVHVPHGGVHGLPGNREVRMVADREVEARRGARRVQTTGDAALPRARGPLETRGARVAGLPRHTHC